MMTKEIMLSRIEEVKAFVSFAMTRDYDIELSSGRYTVDAKSIMGIFSLDLTRPMTLTAHCEGDADLEAAVAPYLYTAE